MHQMDAYRCLAFTIPGVDIPTLAVELSVAHPNAAVQKQDRSKSCALVPNQDHASGTANELAGAQHAGATIVRVDGSRVAMISHAAAVVELIDAAVRTINERHP